jgi:hypothetical protein
LNVCLIVDVDVAGLFLARPSAIRKWLAGQKGNPRLVAAGKLRRELAKTQEVRDYLVELNRAGLLRSSFGEDLLHKTENQLRKSRVCVSNDLHVLALAIVSGARTIATADASLARDVRNKKIIDKPRGSVYRRPNSHSHLLRHTSSCGIQAP